MGFGLIANQALHAYQGVRNLPQHALFYGITVALLYSPFGLMAAVVLHLFGDLTHASAGPMLKWVRNYRAWQRSDTGP